jgi:transposase
MTLKKYNVTSEREKLLQVVNSNQYISRIRKRAMAVNMLLAGAGKELISKTLCISVKSVENYKKRYDEHGISGLTTEHYQGQSSELDNYRDEIISSLQEKPCTTAIEVKQRIKAISGLERCVTQIRSFLKKTGLSI